MHYTEELFHPSVSFAFPKRKFGCRYRSCYYRRISRRGVKEFLALCSASSSHVLPTLSEIVTRVDPAALSTILDPKGPAFVCQSCFSSLKPNMRGGSGCRYIGLFELEVRHCFDLRNELVKKETYVIHTVRHVTIT